MSLRQPKTWLALVIGALAYYGAARIGYSIAFVHGTVAAVWPPTGVALALVWLGGPAMLPAVFLGELTGDLGNHTSLGLSIAFACGSTCEALAGYALLKASGFRRDLGRVRDVFALLGLAALVSTIVSATIGTAALLISGQVALSETWSTWHVWWLGDVTGDVVVAPLLLVLAGLRPRLPAGRRLGEWAAFALTLAALVLISRQLTLGIAYLVLPVLIWAALRFRQPGAVVANAVLAGAVVLGAGGGTNVFSRVDALDRILFTQNFVAIGAVTTLALAAVIAERDRTAQRLRTAETQASALAAERSALGDIATVIAHQQALEKTLELVAGYAGKLFGGHSARLEPLADGDLKSAPDRLRAIVMAGQEKWGALVVEGVDGAALAPARLQLLQHFADLAGLAVASDRTRSQLQREAATDSLTGLANQRAFQRELADEMSRARRHRRPLSLVMLDLDNFKVVNDAEGHLAGDLALTEVAARVRGALRLEAHVARIGGDELAVILPECDAHGGYVTAERVREAVRAAETPGGHRLTVSAGVATLEHGSGPLAFTASADDLIRAADAALYNAKRLGGDSAVRFTPKLTQPLPPVSDGLRGRRADGAQA